MATFRTTLTDMVSEMNTLPFADIFEGLNIYNHLLGVTKEENKIALKTHRDVFNAFFEVNYDVITNLTKDIVLVGQLKYPKGKACVDIEGIWKQLDQDLDSKSGLLQHIVVISNFSSPKRRIDDIDAKLAEIAKTFESEKCEVPERAKKDSKNEFDTMFDRDDEVDTFIRDTIGKLFSKGINSSNPMQTIMQLMRNPQSLKGLLNGKTNISMKRVVMRLSEVMPD